MNTEYVAVDDLIQFGQFSRYDNRWRLHRVTELARRQLIEYTNRGYIALAPVADALLIWNTGGFDALYCADGSPDDPKGLRARDWLDEVLLPIHKRALEEKERRQNLPGAPRD